MDEFSNIDTNAHLGSSRSDSYLFVQKTDLTFQIIERLTRQKSRLLTIRKYVSPENIDVVYALLQDDAYLHFSSNDIRNQLMKSPNHMLDNQVPRASSAH